MIVMDYAKEGNLGKSLPNIIKYTWQFKLRLLNSMIYGLYKIHKKELIHCDLHNGNILNYRYMMPFISDLGLSKPIEYFQSPVQINNIYGVLPFMAPEVLRGKPYTQASDIQYIVFL